jgi:catechol 2,3-dioxygenase-like lactoylglutathione lyase family enzyme
MRGEVSAAVPVCYVKNLEQARDFYGLIGYREVRSGGDGTGASWSYLQSGDHTLLLAYVQPPLIQVELPLLIYLYVNDLTAVRERFAEAGHALTMAGHPEHAPGGEARTQDPDGNVVLVGQRAVTGERAPEHPDDTTRFSLIQQAAETISRRGGAPAVCQVGEGDGSSCPQPAEVKLADPWGETVWACLAHADEALINARSAFIATEDEHGLGPWLRQRRNPG